MRSIDFSAYAAPNQPDTDYSPILSVVMADALTQAAQEIYFPKGYWYFFTPIPPVRGVRLAGKDATDTYFSIKHSGNGIFMDGLIPGGGVQDLCIVAANGGNSNVGLMFYGTQASSPDFVSCKNILVTANPGSSWYYGLDIDGTQRLTPQGVRGMRFEHVDLFAATQLAIYLRNAVFASFDSVGCFPAGGSTGNVLITDGSTLIHMDAAQINGTVTVNGGANDVWCNGTKIA